ncbi:MAG: hypothetical protein HY069_02800 [Chlamydiia bacterium]|nr:hypothetical protein [Chlamydiia bacterium]
MSTQLETPQATPFDDAFFQHNLPQYYRAILQKFKKVVANSVRFHLIFATLMLAEICFSLPILRKPALFAFALGLFFLTVFCYCILFFYMSAKKPEQLTAIREEFLTACRQLLPTPPGEAQHHLSLAAALLKLSAYLDSLETQPPAYLQALEPLIQSMSKYCYRKDVFRMQQLLLHAAIEEHLKQIRITPTDLELHASLANAYVDLSQLYEPHIEHQKKCEAAHRLAIDEFKILSHYAPNDPWAHEQLADGYHAMKMVQEETEEVELLSRLKPQNPDVLFRLGALYFEQGRNANGLKVYEELIQLHYKKAEELIALYGSL